MAKLLVADEDVEAADVLADALRLNGHAARACYSDRQCLKLISEFRPDAVLLFIAGLEIARELRSEVPVIDGRRLRKPLDMLDLMCLVRQAV